MKGFFKKLLIVAAWTMIAIGLYQCSVHLSGMEEDIVEDVEEQEEIQTISDESPEKDTTIESIPETLLDENVRILLMNRGYHGIYHTELHITCSEGMTITHHGETTEYEPASEVVLRTKDFEDDQMICIAGKNDGRIQINNIERNSPAQYRGKLECYPTAEGIVAVNELTVEEYLYGVVPSEMPSTYPDEALKAQAVSARTYTYFHKQSYAYPEWRAHMDDSTAFQVYMNCEETPSAVRAVDETKNQVLTHEGELAYQQYIDHGNEEDIEYHEAWYRWSYARSLEGKAVGTFLQKLYDLSLAQPDTVRIRSRYLSSDQLPKEGAVRDIRILSRRKSGMAAGIMIETEHFRVSVMSQYAIRQALGCAQDIVTKNDGSSYIMGDILPSAYFYIEKIYDNNGETGDNLKQIIIHGAGFGHGCGMSQNGAKNLADGGLTAAQILAYYYNGSIREIGELNEECQ